MASCFEFFLSLKFGKRAKGFLWRTTKAQAQPQLLKAPKSCKFNHFLTFMDNFMTKKYVKILI